MQNSQNQGNISFPTIQNYELSKHIAEGTFGSVFKGVHKNTNQNVAVKIFHHSLDKTGTEGKIQMARFEREIQICTELNHPYIVKLLDKGFINNNVPYIVFEYIEGTNLKNYIIDKGQISAQETKDFMIQILDALACAHDKGIIHRDLKPENIMVSKTGAKSHIKILDFGISWISHEHNNSLLPQSLGTPLYSAPEQLRGESPSQKSDIYAWGLMLLECLQGKAAIKGNSLAEIYYEQLNGGPISMPQNLINHPLGSLLERVLDKNPITRAGNTLTLFQEFESIDFGSLDIDQSIHKPKPLQFDQTNPNELFQNDNAIGKRLITHLGIQARIKTLEGCALDEEMIDTILIDQIKTYADLASNFGGYVASKMAGNILTYFGYPLTNEHDTRLAGRTALSILNHNRRKNQLLGSKYKISIELGIAIHSGNVFYKSGTVPTECKSAITTFNLMNLAANGEIVASDTAKTMLQQYMDFEKINSNSNESNPQLWHLKGEHILDSFAYISKSQNKRRFFGRDQEYSQLLSFWNSQNAISDSILLLQGEAGIGKSKLLFEFKQYLTKQTNSVYETRCLPEFAHHTLYPILEIFKKLAGIKTDHTDEEQTALIVEALKSAHCDIELSKPIFLNWLGIAFAQSTLPPSTLDPKSILTNGLKQYITHALQNNKILLVIEDLHWSDESTLTFLSEFGTKTQNLNGKWLCTSRSNTENTFQDAIAHQLTLKPLDFGPCAEIIFDVMNTKNIDSNAIEFIIEKTDGIPMFVEEFTKMLSENGKLSWTNNQYQITGLQNNVEVPITLKELLSTRLDKMGFAKETLQLAATIGKEVPYGILASSSLKENDILDGDLEKIIQSDLMYIIHNSVEDIYIFRHALFREVAYESMSRIQKQQAHDFVADTLRSRIENNIDKGLSQNQERLAQHLFEAGKTFEAIEWLEKAAIGLVRKSANQEVVSLCQKAIKWFQQVPDDQLKYQKEFEIRQLLLTNLIAVESYGSVGVGEQLDALSLLFEKIDSEEKMFPSMFLYSNYYMMRANSKAAIEVSKQLANKAKEIGNDKWTIVASGFLGVHLFNDGQFKEAQNVLENALKLFDPQLHSDLAYEFGVDLCLLSASILASAYVHLGIEEKVADLEKFMIARSNELEHHHSTASIYLGLCCTHYYNNDRDKVLEYSQALLDLNKTHKMNMFSNYARLLHAWANMDLKEALQAMEDEKNSGMQSMRSVWYAILADIEINKGMYQTAKDRLFECLSYIGTTDGAIFEADIHFLLGKIFKHLDDHISSESHILNAKKISTERQSTRIFKKINEYFK